MSDAGGLKRWLSGTLADYARSPECRRDWIVEAITRLRAEVNRSSDTHLHRLQVAAFPGVELYLKDEAIHPTGSLKHRLARSLILYGVCNGDIGPNTTLVEASSGSTAVSEAYFASLIGLPFIAVVPHGTSPRKVAEIQRFGGQVKEVSACEIYAAARQLADACDGYYLDQFTYAERVTDWRGNNNIAESLFQQMAFEKHPAPRWIVVGAGTGGTSATIGRYLRYEAQRFGTTRVCVADPERSVFFDGYSNRKPEDVSRPSRIEGVGRPRMEPSFIPLLVDRMLKVQDAASFACMHWLKTKKGRSFGPSTGLNVYAALSLAAEMHEHNQPGSIVTLICDSGDRYEETAYSRSWLAQQQLDIDQPLKELAALD